MEARGTWLSRLLRFFLAGGVEGAKAPPRQKLAISEDIVPGRNGSMQSGGGGGGGGGGGTHGGGVGCRDGGGGGGGGEIALQLQVELLGGIVVAPGIVVALVLFESAPSPSHVQFTGSGGGGGSGASSS